MHASAYSGTSGGAGEAASAAPKPSRPDEVRTVPRRPDPKPETAQPPADQPPRSSPWTVPIVIDPSTIFRPVLPPGSTLENLDFELGTLDNWTAGKTLRRQPTYGDNVATDRIRPLPVSLGGDYWKGMPYPIGKQGDYWVGTYEDRPDPESPWGGAAGEGRMGEITSVAFTVDRPLLSFLVGGGSDPREVRVELLVDGAAVDAIARRNAETARRWGGRPGGLPGSGNPGRTRPLPTGRREGNNMVFFTTAGQGSERMRQVTWDISPFIGAAARIRIVDQSRTAHINADDFRFHAGAAPPAPMPVWGFADTHTHPANYLAFGGGLIQGRLYAPSPGEAGLREALPPIFGLAGGGYPRFDAYPKFDNIFGQQMYTDWVRRAFEGGLRLMSALAVNNWLVSSHRVKQRLLGATQPADDRESAFAQLADVRTWASQNSDWVEIASSPEHARRIISQNKLAVVLGVEVDLLGNFAPNRSSGEPEIRVLDPNPATPAAEAAVRSEIAAELDRLRAAGVRQITPLHYVSGMFGGTAIFERLFNEVNRRFTGRNYTVESGDRFGIRYRLNNDNWGISGEALRLAVSGAFGPATVDPSWERVPLGHVNQMGLTRSGEILFEELARRAMIVDIDHASHKAADRLLDLAERLDYPLMSSHSDYADLAATGPAEFTHGIFGDDDAENFEHFGTTLHSNLRHEGMGLRSKFERIARLGGTTAPLTSTYRRSQWGGRVRDPSEGSSKTWAQMYQYALDVSGGRGVALSTDRGLIRSIGPRFGPNAAVMLGEERVEALARILRGQQVEAQTNGVRYDRPIVEWRDRLRASGRSAYDYTGKAFEHDDAWRAIAAFKAGRNPWTMGAAAEIPGGPPDHPGRTDNMVRGFFAASEAQLESECGLLCAGNTLPERAAAYYVRRGEPLPARWRADPAFVEHYDWVRRVWDHWHRMDGANPPLRRHVFGSRDFDINIDGMAHYGMLPDLLQDVRNSGLGPAELQPLFRSAEDYILMWEKAERRRTGP